MSMRLLPKNEFPVKGRTILITGGSRGTGREAARQLAEKGANVAIVARDERRLEEGIAYIRAGAAFPGAQRFLHISADLMKADESVRVVSLVKAWNAGAPPDIVWCCAGSSHPTLFVDTPVSTFSSVMESNYFSSVYMAHAILQAWLHPDASKGVEVESEAESSPLARHLIFTGSFLSLYSVAGYTPYSPAKAALRSLADGLSQELNLYAGAHPAWPPVRVHCVFPAAILTESFEQEQLIKSDMTKMLEESDKGQTPQRVAQLAIQALEGGQELIATDILTKLVMSSVLGASKRGGFWRGLCNWLLGCLMALVLVFVREDMDRKVRDWGRLHGASGMKRL